MQTDSKVDLYRSLPSVDELVKREPLVALAAKQGQPAVTDAVRSVLGRLRNEIAAGRLHAEKLQLALSCLVEAVEGELRRALSHSLTKVINATGVILHTNLGRAPLAASALEHIRETAEGYSNLEFDLEAGERGKRDVHVARLFEKLLGAGVSTIVVNNNAAAVLLALNTLAEGAEVIVSRGELVEIGGSFRIPDVMAKSNAILREVGTTNRTRISDYERAITDKTRLLLRVHRSNFEITGFTEQVALEELVHLARERKIPLLEDLGSGLLDLHSGAVDGEPDVLDSLRSGVDVVTYSGDKLLGGPQAGILSGRADLIEKMRSNSLFRALRVDKLTYAALEATLIAYVQGDYERIPVLRLLRLGKQEIARRAQAVAERLSSSRLSIETIDGESLIGGGAAPTAVLPTCLLALRSDHLSAQEISARLLAFVPPVITRVEEGCVLVDLRTVFPEQDPVVVEALRRVANS
ncbi:MAG TPA: L-seryl-tRNA(Sec) selenium transferase [Terriglobales bacterium]|nr:L-seryl-tRNA(Sec) selenium transferase [Terriglobales bacterium]